MQNRPLAEEPKYLIGSVDGALQLLQLLRDEGSLRVMDAADHLDVSRSTAHRLLSMLVYRGFAVQDEDRIYQPGPGMNVPPVQSGSIRAFKQASEPHFLDFTQHAGSTVSLVTRFGTTARFIETYVPQSLVAVSSRRGQILPARQTSGGKALLAQLPDRVLQQLYRSKTAALNRVQMNPADFARFMSEIAEVRQNGYALNREETEFGVWALGMALSPPEPRTWVAFAVALPREKSYLLEDESFIAECRELQRRINGAAPQQSGRADS